MEDKRIQELTEEVLSKLADQPETADLEQRLAALERTGGQRSAVRVPGGGRAKHVALRVIEVVSGGDDECLLEPDQPCTKSGRCRTFGY